MVKTTYPNLKKRRKELGLTLKEVAEAVDVNPSTISRWETGDIKNMRALQIDKLAEVLKTSPLWIMGYELNDEFCQDLLKKIRRAIELAKFQSVSFHEEKDNARRKISDLDILITDLEKLTIENLEITIGYMQFLLAQQEKKG